MSLCTPESETKFEDYLFNFSQSSSECDEPHSKNHHQLKQSEPPQNRNKNGHIKIPMNAFMVWAQVNRKIMAAKNPSMSNLEVSRLLGNAWNAMTPEDRMPYIDRAKEIRIEHLEKYPEFKYQPRRRRRKLTKTVLKSNPSSTELPLHQHIVDDIKPEPLLQDSFSVPYILPTNYFVSGPNIQMPAPNNPCSSMYYLNQNSFISYANNNSYFAASNQPLPLPANPVPLDYNKFTPNLELPSIYSIIPENEEAFKPEFAPDSPLNCVDNDFWLL